MEKIQAAIAKARAERQAAQGLQPTRQDREAAARMEAEPAPSVAAQWDGMEERRFDAKHLQRNRIVAHARDRESTAVDMMRTRVVQQMRANKWRRMAVTSPTAACGKTTVSLNLAVSLSHQQDLRTMLLDLDLRRPELARMAGLTDRPADLAQVLRGERPFTDNVVRYGSNLALGVNSRKIGNASELLASAGVADMLAGIEAVYQPDIMIFDMPPMLATDDMMAFARHVDCVLIVAEAERTTTREVDLCEQELARQTNIMGVVLNQCRYMGPEFDYGYYD